MIVFPNAKINLGLQILGKRTDGYHNLSTVFYPVPLCDILEAVIIKDKENLIAGNYPFIEFSPGGNQKIYFSTSGLQITGSSENNLCLKACRIFNEHAGIRGNIAVHLHKVIPMGAGLGGGSSDGAFMLKLLNHLSGSPLNELQLMDLAAMLGSDCAFFIQNTPSIASGRGEILEPVNVNLSGKYVKIIYPGIHISTATAFSEIKIKPLQPDLKKIISDPALWKRELKNDFEESLFSQFPVIELLKKSLIDSGASFASMSGSGSAVFGIFENRPVEQDIWKNYQNFQFILS